MSNLIVRALTDTFSQQTRSAGGDSFNLESFFSGPSLTSTVNYKSALALSAVFNAVDQISNDIAKLPKGVYQKDGKNRFRLSSHAVDYIVSKRPNALMTQFNFHKALGIHAMLRGDGVAVIKFDSVTGYVKALELVKPDDLNDIKKKNGELYYYIKGYSKPLTSQEVIHIPGFSFNGISGCSIFKYAAMNLGAAISAEKFANDNFKSKGLLAGLIRTPKSLKSSAKVNLSNALEARLSKGGTHNIGVLDEGMEYQGITVNAQEASLIDWKKISIEDVARWFNIAPHKIKHLANATYSNIEQQSIEHGTDTVMPWAKKFEEEYDYKLFTEDERKDHYIKFNTNALIRTDIKTKGEYYSKAVNFGWKTRNEVRALEDDNPIEGLDEPLTPANTFTLEQLENQRNNEN